MSKKFIWELEEEKSQKALEQEKKRKLEKKRKRRKKRTKKLVIRIMFFLFFIFIFFTPFFKINKINVSNNYYFNSDQITKDLDFNNRFSIAGLVQKFFTKRYTLYYLDKSKIAYDFKTGVMTITVGEKIPLYHDEEGNNYYYSDNGDVGEWDIAYTTPLIIGLNSNDNSAKDVNEKLQEENSNEEKVQDDTDANKNIVLNDVSQEEGLQEMFLGLSELDYEVRSQIKTIEYADETEYGKNVLKMSMIDGNTVYIYPYQISSKMKYYNQMKQILDANEKSSGNIYLYIGDYYDPYD